jgi:magnesium-transporting ATPase (P-type)
MPSRGCRLCIARKGFAGIDRRDQRRTKTFANTLKYIYISTGSTFGNMCSVAAASLILPFLPMLPKQILLTNSITDFPYLTVASDNVDEEQLENPGKWNLKGGFKSKSQPFKPLGLSSRY